MGTEAGKDARPLVMHVVYRFDTGGLENGVVNLLNHLPVERFRHLVVSLTEVTEFRRRVRPHDVEFIALNKGQGHALWLYPRLWRLIRHYKPAIVHTRNLAALEVVVPAWLAGVPVRLHGEHGRDVTDLHGTCRRYQWARRLYRPFVTHYVALSRDLAEYLVQKINVPRERIAHLCNGVDTDRFRPAQAGETRSIAGCPFSDAGFWLLGTVGRMQPVKDQLTLSRAFVRALRIEPSLRERIRLVMIGDGPLREQCRAVLEAEGCGSLAWIPGERADVADIMRGLDCFVLPSLAEGVSNTILEAMASGLPVIATSVGGNADLVEHGRTGEIVAAGDVSALAESLVRMARQPGLAAQMGRAGRRAAETRFSLRAMVDAYEGLYVGQLGMSVARQGA